MCYNAIDLGENSMRFLLELFNTWIYFRCVLNIGELFFCFTQRKWKYKKEILGIVVFLSTIIMLYADIGLKAIIYFASVFVVLCIWFKEKTKILLCFYLGVTIVIAMLSTLFEVITMQVLLFFGIEEISYVFRVVNLLIIFICIRIVGNYFITKYASGFKSISAKYWMLFTIILIVDAVVVLLLGDFVLNVLNAERKYIAIISYWCVVIGLLIQLVLLINTLVTRNVHKENEKLAKQFLESQNEHYQYLEKREHETKKFRHDIKNHLMLLENFMNNQKYDEAEEYLKTINQKVSTFSNQISVNNGIADAILNRFYTEAKEKGITLKVSGHFPMECYITAYDICTVFSNLLSNAIRAELEAEGKEVLVNIKYTNDKVLLTVENDYVNELYEVDGVFKTTKEDSIGHGYGLSNVKECVETNGGYLSIATENHRFKVMIMMLNEKEDML